MRWVDGQWWISPGAGGRGRPAGLARLRRGRAGRLPGGDAMHSGFVGEAISGFLGGTIDTIMNGIWAAAVGLLRGAFQLADAMTTTHFVSVDTTTAATSTRRTDRHRLADRHGVAGAAVAVAGDRGGPVLRAAGLDDAARRPRARCGWSPARWRTRSRPAMTAGGIGLLFAAGDGLAAVLLQAGLRADGFVGVLDSPTAQAMFGPAPTLEPSGRSTRTGRPAARRRPARSTRPPARSPSAWSRCSG